MFNGDDGLRDYLFVTIGPESISNGTLTIDLWGKPVFDWISNDEWDYLEDISANMAQEIIDKAAPSTVIGDNGSWNMTFTWDTCDDLDESYWKFDDGSTCDWDDLK